MKGLLSVPAALALAAAAHGQWWNGAPECAHQCFASHWPSSSHWPAPTSYCSARHGASVTDCISSACAAHPTAVTSYSSLSASVCARWASCSAAGSTGVYTISAPAFTGYWRPGKYGHRGHWHRDDHDDYDDHDDWHDDNHWHEWARTWPGGVYTVTGCEWNGNPWAGGPGGWGHGGAAGSPWGPWGRGWRWTTLTETVTRFVTATDAAGAKTLSTSVGLATVAQAVSGDVTSTSLIAAETAAPDSSASSSGAAAGSASADDLGVKIMGALLAGVLALAGWL